MIHGLPALALKSGREEQRCWESEKVRERQRQRERGERKQEHSIERKRQTEREERFQSKPAILSILRFSTF